GGVDRPLVGHRPGDGDGLAEDGGGRGAGRGHGQVGGRQGDGDGGEVVGEVGFGLAGGPGGNDDQGAIARGAAGGGDVLGAGVAGAGGQSANGRGVGPDERGGPVAVGVDDAVAAEVRAVQRGPVGEEDGVLPAGRGGVGPLVGDRPGDGHGGPFDGGGG